MVIAIKNSVAIIKRKGAILKDVDFTLKELIKLPDQKGCGKLRLVENFRPGLTTFSLTHNKFLIYLGNEHKRKFGVKPTKNPD